MNILLTGGAGYIGSHTAIVLCQLGHKAVLYDNLANSSYGVLKRISEIVGREVLFVEGDMRNTELLQRTMLDYRIDIVIHFAGLKAVGESVLKPLEYYANNLRGTISLLQAMRTHGVKRLIFSSSATVYGEPKYLPLDEDHPINITNPYARTKIQIEKMLSCLPQASSDWRTVCLRYFNPVGAHESGLIGEEPQGLPNNLMPFVGKVAAGKIHKLNIYGDDYPTPDGTGVRDYIHVMDLAMGHSAALDFIAENAGQHTFNLGTGKGYSVFEMIRAFENASGCNVPYQIVSRRPGDIAECVANPKKAERFLGWSAKRTLQDMCLTSWRYYHSPK